MVDGGYQPGMYSSAGMIPISAPQVADPNMYASPHYGQPQYGGGYPGYNYSMVQPGNIIDASGGSGLNMAQDTTNMQPMVIDAGISGNSPYSFIMPAGVNGTSQPDASLQAFQQSFGGNYSFYDTNAFGNGSMMPQGFVSGYEQLPNGETKKAVKKQPARKDVASPKKVTKAKTLFPCC